MRILGIDPALSITGYGVIEVNKNNLSLVEAGVISTTPKEVLPERLYRINSAIKKLISDTKPDVLVLEKLYVHYRHPVTAFLLGQARGVICLACAECKVPLVEYPATRVKKIIVGAGLAGKYQVQRMVANMLNIDKLPKYADVTDALALAIAHSHMLKNRISR
ncbi:MAG: crossover junction endodeoxyribonuclease RuvC [Candidatus Omnitrophica bacterium]|nr:crossover junction endodeoxyribonuclease RuvC [Candidatus Omnitrophota bacterium]